MKKYRWQLLIVLVTGLIVGILLIIQQMDDGEEIQSTPSPISGGVYTEALIGEFMRLNPFLDLYNEPDRAVDQLIFNSLVKFDSRGIPQSDLAESWGVSKDGTVYNFSLRTDVYWHDGEPFNSQDVLYTIGLLQSQHNLIPEDLRNFWAEVEVVALSDIQLQFLLPEPFAPFLDYLSFGILPEHILGGLGMDGLVDHSFNLAPVGTGPFRFQRLIVENDKIAGVVLEAFDAYFLERPYLDEFIFRYYPSSQDALIAYREGEVEGIGKVHSSILTDVLSEPDLSVYTTREPLLTMIYLNLNNPEVGFLQNPDFRRALLAAINRDAIIEQVFNGQAVQANGPILPGTWAHYNDLEKVPFNLVEAKRLFKSTGVTFDEEAEVYRSETDLEISLTLLHPDTAEHTQIAEQIQADWEELGVNVTLESKPYENVLEDLSLRNYETALVDINFTRSPDPDPYPFWGQAQVQSGQNYAEWDNRSASEFLEQARMTADFGERERLYRNFQVLFMRELPSLPLFYPVYTYAVTEDINGIKLGPLFEPSDRFNNVHEWYILSGVDTNGNSDIKATDSVE
ncbi:MAG: Putative ABC transporter substrate binding protein [Anaerolinea thermophila]|uniref:Putative ABC transporter substrate binding protein n=1 Tax=Anaerolinea thermophila TaxID=167964 RepID=A0A117LGF0_9CHLR|nr:MAG: Putative ABC transporter substrate binding protein [Anaerolinea thermophila]